MEKNIAAGNFLSPKEFFPYLLGIYCLFWQLIYKNPRNFYFIFFPGPPFYFPVIIVFNIHYMPNNFSTSGQEIIQYPLYICKVLIFLILISQSLARCNYCYNFSFRLPNSFRELNNKGNNSRNIWTKEKRKNSKFFP